MIWIGVEDIILIHSKIIQKSGGIDGIRDRSCLESAVAAPMQSFGGQDFFPSDVEKIARLGYGLATNHAFLDGNKRIGGELADMFIALADDRATEEELLDWIRTHLK